jgi:hypothetical protein
MFCSRCGQHFVTDTRFCSRCGLQLNVIAEVTANQGMVIGDGGLRERTPRQKGLRFGTILILAALAITPLFFAWAVVADGPAPLLAPLTIFLTGLCFVLYSRAFKDDFYVSDKRQQYQFGNPPNTPVLSLPERPIDGFTSRKVKKDEMAAPPSVTDHTTQFFD